MKDFSGFPSLVCGRSSGSPGGGSSCYKSWLSGMGAVCGKKKAAAEPKTRKAAVEVSDAPPDPNSPQPQPIAASAVCPATKPAKKPANKVKEFVTGDGDGVYLLLASENNSTSLVQQYAHSKPELAEGDSLLLQIKPPMYVEIKSSRFVLQNGKRTLKMGIPVGRPLYLNQQCCALADTHGTGLAMNSWGRVTQGGNADTGGKRLR